jgi:hypothetical protein
MIVRRANMAISVRATITSHFKQVLIRFLSKHHTENVKTSNPLLWGYALYLNPLSPMEVSAGYKRQLIPEQMLSKTRHESQYRWLTPWFWIWNRNHSLLNGAGIHVQKEYL